MESTDPRSMRALTHPLRLDLMELLAANGPATAAACGRALGVPQANCSFHLRQLAKYGYVEQAEKGEDRRERLWRISATRPATRFGPESDGIVKRRLERLVVERETQAILDYLDGQGDQGPENGRAGVIAAIAALTPQDAAELKRKWREIIEPYIVTTRPANEEPDDPDHPSEDGLVRVFLAMTPTASIKRADRGESGHERKD